MVPEINIPTLLQRSSTTATSKVISNNPLSPNTSLMLLLFFSLLLNLVLLFNLFTAPGELWRQGKRFFSFSSLKVLFFFFFQQEMSGRNRFPFSASQWQELEHQALIFKYMASGIPIPPDLLYTIKRSCLDSSLSSKFFPHQPHQHGKPTTYMFLKKKKKKTYTIYSCIYFYFLSVFWVVEWHFLVLVTN